MMLLSIFNKVSIRCKTSTHITCKISKTAAILKIENKIYKFNYISKNTIHRENKKEVHRTKRSN